MRIILCSILLLLNINILGVTIPVVIDTEVDSNEIEHKNSFGGTPILAFDSDLGLRYGVVANWFQYGGNYPNYERFVQLKAFNSTKRTFNTSIILDDQLSVKNTRMILEIGFSQDQALNFYGFNGGQSVFDEMLIQEEHVKYYNSFFFSYKRRLFRGRVDFQTKLKDSKINLIYGLGFNRYMIDPTNLNLLHTEPTNINQDITLYEYYNEWGIIPEDEKSGGTVNYAKIGLSIDTRNLQIGCTQGLWLESYLIGSPKSKGNQGFIKHITTLRHYLKIPNSKLLFTYRLSSQQKLGGTIPNYFLPTFFDSQGNQDGIGGAFTLRGIPRNRILGDGFVLGNFELRRPVLNFKLMDVKCILELSVFSDAAMITQKYGIDSANIPDMYANMLFNDTAQNIYSTAGVGVYFRYNSNNVISMNYGVSKQQGMLSSGLYVGSSFLF